jgi:hypothetical protein
MKITFPTACIAMCLASGAAMAGTESCYSIVNHVQNCGFETGDFTDWTISGSAYELAQTNLYGIDSYNPLTGSYDAFFANQGATLGTHLSTDSLILSQSMNLTVNRTFDVSFYIDQDTPVFTGYTNYFAALWNGTTLMSETAAPVTGGYIFESFVVTSAAVLSNTLSFDFQNDDGDWFIDDISVTEIPEPASLALLGAGALALAGWRVRRRTV